MNPTYQQPLPPEYESVLSRLAANPMLMTLLGALIGQYKMDGHPVKGGMAGLATSLFWNLIKKKEEVDPVSMEPPSYVPQRIFPEPPSHYRYGR